MAFAKAKTELINFLKHASKSEAHLYSFKLPLMSNEDGHKFIHRMRVELSRFRDVIQSQGKQLRPFKMMFVTMQHTQTNTEITLRYRNTVDAKTLKDVDDVFDVVSTGSTIINERAARDLPAQPLNLKL